MSTPSKPTNTGPRKSARKPRTRNADDGTPTISESDSAYVAEEKKMNPMRDKKHPRSKPQPNKQVIASGDGIQDPKNMLHGEKARATPIKQAYAGPTFHHSPAASALPMPSFYSKSVPTTSTLASTITADQIDQDSPSKVADDKEDTPTKKEPTPLDFLFDAARRARAEPRSESPGNTAGTLSVPAGTPVSRSPAPKEGDAVFPFDMDGPDSAGEDGKSFATPFKARMAALQSTRSTSEGGRGMDEQERKAKTAALKQFLMTSPMNQQHHPPSNMDMNNPFNARPVPQQYHPGMPYNNRPHSGPSTPGYGQNHYHGKQQQQYFPHQLYQSPPSAPSVPNAFYTSPTKPLPSNLRNVYGAEHGQYPIGVPSDRVDDNNRPGLKSTRRQSSQSHVPQHIQGKPGNTRPQTAGDTPHKSMSTPQELEDDLRRVLKLDLVSRG